MNQLFVIITIILLPGVIATVICNKLTVHSKWDAFKFGLYSLILGIFSYTVLQSILYLKDAFLYFCTSSELNWTHLQIWNAAIIDKPIIPANEIVISLLLSIPIAFITSWVVQNKVINKIATKFNISTKYGDENLYTYYLNTNEIDWIYIRDFKNNLTYQGRVELFSENENIQEIVLSNVTVFRYEDSKELYSIPTIYLSNKDNNFIIEAIPDNLLGEDNGKENIN